MCGIAGCTGEDDAKIRRMTQALVHRGPDGHAVLLTHGASLGHARLAILDPSPLGDQPMWNDGRTAVIVYNGEIFNYRALKEAEKFSCRTGSDTEVLLKLYDRYGIDCVQLLRGMFAFGLYDIRTQTWYVVRDSSGIKPLFVAYPNGVLHFASEMRSLLQSLPSKPALNLRSLSQYVRLHYVPGPQTLCEGIESVPPSTIITSRDGRETRRSFQAKVEPILYNSKEQFQHEFPLRMDMAVRDHLVSDKPVGIFLSGGMDSSIVLHHMANHAKRPIKTFTVRFEASAEEDEERFNRDARVAAHTAAHYGTDHTEIVLTAGICREVYADTAKALDQPNADSVAMAQFILAREAKKHIDVVLTGSGGDELFGGYPRYRIAKILHALRLIPPSLRSGIGSLLGYPPDVLAMQPGPTLAERLLARPLKEITPILRGHWFDASATTMLFHERFETQKKSQLLRTDPLRAFMEFDRDLWLVDESLRLGDAVTMASGLECRVPFLDPLIIAASHGTESDWHVGWNRTKTLLKDTYYPLLPHGIRSIGKSSFYPPLAKWLRRECAPLVEQALENRHLQELFDVTELRTVLKQHQSHEQYGLHTLQMIIQLRAWFEMVYDA